MKTNIYKLIFVSILIGLLLCSCENPLFVNAIGLYQVDFSSNGGTEVPSCRTNRIKVAPETQREDSDFLGWYKSSSFSGEPVTFPLDIVEDTILYAKWRIYYNVSFETNGGSAVETIKAARIDVAPRTSKDNYTFGGWYLTSDFSDESVNFPYDVKEQTILYAKWLPNYQVSFETNGGTSIDTYNTGEISSMPTTSKNGFIFGGWYLEADFSGNQVNFPCVITRPTTFYAKWIPTYDVSFEVNGGSTISSFRAIQITSAPSTNRDGYTFIGWYKDSAFTQSITFPYVLTADTVLYAKWQRNYNVSFVTNGGSAVATISAGVIETAPVSTKNDASLEGWYTDSELISASKVTFPYVVTGDIILYAKWQPVQCIITYYSNGATSGTVPASVSVDKGSSYTIPGNTGNLSKTGYAFTKWATSTNGASGANYSVGQSITVTTNLNLYAQWGKDYAAMVTVPGGTFYFGDPRSSERPRITLSSFQIAQYELTYELWLEVYNWAIDHGYNLTAASKGYAANDQYKSFVPATKISWNMACVWLNAYSEYKNLEPVYYRGSAVWKDDTSASNTFSWNRTKNGYRLPTECEWEFAAGGGSETEHDFNKYAGSNTIDIVAWYYGNTTGNTTMKEFSPVGTKKANKLNIFDMSGNVAEWCYDYFSDWGTGELTNPVHEHQDYTYTVIRGGSVYTNYNVEFYRRGKISNATSSSSYSGIGDYWRDEERGIRIARNAE